MLRFNGILHQVPMLDKRRNKSFIIFNWPLPFHSLFQGRNFLCHLRRVNTSLVPVGFHACTLDDAFDCTHRLNASNGMVIVKNSAREIIERTMIERMTNLGWT